MPQPVLRGKSRLRGDIGPSHVVRGSLQPRWDLNLVPKLCYLLPLELQAWLPGLGGVGWGAQGGMDPSHLQPGLAPPVALTPESGSRESLGMQKEVSVSAPPPPLALPSAPNTGHGTWGQPLGCYVVLN